MSTSTLPLSALQDIPKLGILQPISFVAKRMDEGYWYFLVCLVVLVGMIKTLHNTGLVSLFIVAHTEAAIHQGQYTRYRRCDDDNCKAVWISWSLICGEHQRPNEIPYNIEVSLSLSKEKDTEVHTNTVANE